MRDFRLASHVVRLREFKRPELGNGFCTEGHGVKVKDLFLRRTEAPVGGDTAGYFFTFGPSSMRRRQLFAVPMIDARLAKLLWSF